MTTKMSRFVTTACYMCTGAVAKSFSQQQRMVSVFWARLARTGVQGVRLLHVSSASRGSVGEGFHRPSNFDKKILVWTKKYSDVSEVPSEVSNVQMKKAKDLFRIRVNLMMIAATVVLAVVYAWSGRRAARQGDSIVLRNRLWHASSDEK